MDKKRKNVQFRKSIDWNEIPETIIPEHRRNPQNTQDSKKIIKNNNQSIKKQNKISLNKKSIHEKRIIVKQKLMKDYNLTEKEAEIAIKKIEQKAIQKRKKRQNTQREQTQKQEIENLHKKERENNKNIRYNSTILDKVNNPYEIKEDSKNVDEIISNILPDYNQSIAIELENVSLSFNVTNDKIDNLKEYFVRTLKRNKSKSKKFYALKNISFKIIKGEKVGIIGYNGAGKSTLLNVITGIYPTDTGYVKTKGKISPLLSLGAGFDYNYSGRENIFLNGAVLGYDKKFLKGKYEEIVKFSELEEFIEFPIKNYSSGMLAKLGFSIATIVEPDILIIDEILGVGDINFQKKSSDKIKSLMESGTTVLLVSHSIPQIKELCDKAIWIDKGKVREIGEVNKVCNHYIKDAEKASREELKNIQFK